MHKASREIKKSLEKVDVTIEILDARIPYSSQNPLLASLQGNKPCVKVLNKSDLADVTVIQQWQDFFEQDKGIKTLALSKDQSLKTRQLTDLCRKLAGVVNQPDKIVNALIMGIPNVGKSTLINALAGRAIAKTGDEPAVTKHQQRIAVNQNVVLFDTPGMLWPNVENKHSGYRLAATGAIKDTAINHEEIACYLLEYLTSFYPESLKNRFKLDNLGENAKDLLSLIGKKRGCLRVGGAVELDKAAKILLTEFRGGILGKISLETPEMMLTELVEVESLRQVKADKKQERKKKNSYSNVLNEG